MMYVVTGSPPAGALQASVTELPVDETTRFSGALGAIAPEAVTLVAWIPSPLKHGVTADPARQAPKEGAVAALASARTRNAFGRTTTVVGAVGVDVPQPASTHIVATTPTEASNVRIAILQAKRRVCDWSMSD